MTSTSGLFSTMMMASRLHKDNGTKGSNSNDNENVSELAEQHQLRASRNIQTESQQGLGVSGTSATKGHGFSSFPTVSSSMSTHCNQTYANPLIPNRDNTHNKQRNNSEQKQLKLHVNAQQKTPAVYVNRSKRASQQAAALTSSLLSASEAIPPASSVRTATTTTAPPSGESSSHTAAAAAAAGRGGGSNGTTPNDLRMSCIRSAARALDENTSAVVAKGTTATVEESPVSVTATSPDHPKQPMPAFPVLKTSELPHPHPSGRMMPTTTSNAHQDPPANKKAKKGPATPVSPGLAGVSPSPTGPQAPTLSGSTLAAAQMPPLPQQHHQQPLQSSERKDSISSASSATHHHHVHATTAVGGGRGVPHVYHDFAHVPDTVGYVRKKTGGVTQPFPEKLHELLEKESTPDFHENANAIVGWLPHGRAFLVRKPKEFTRDIMPKYFRQTKLTSFQRQLNLYGFRRLTQGADAGAYYHELFLRGRPQLCLRMVRQKVKGTGHKQPADAQTEPNFYALPPTTGVGSPALSSAASPAMAALAPSPGMTPSSPSRGGDHASPPTTAMATTTSPSSTAFHQAASGRPAAAVCEMSPGTHGAAKLLKGIAAGFAPNRLSSINPNKPVPFLGPPAAAAANNNNHKEQRQQDPPGATTSPTLSYRRQEPQDAAAASSSFTSSPPQPRSSYSSLLWGGVPAAAAATATETMPGSSPSLTARAPPPASFLWPPPPAPAPAAAKASATMEEQNHATTTITSSSTEHKGNEEPENRAGV